MPGQASHVQLGLRQLGHSGKLLNLYLLCRVCAFCALAEHHHDPLTYLPCECYHMHKAPLSLCEWSQNGLLSPPESAGNQPGTSSGSNPTPAPRPSGSGLTSSPLPNTPIARRVPPMSSAVHVSVRESSHAPCAR